jgi:CheY-like chemotaxis protein
LAHLLLVEDDRELQTLMQTFLEALGHQVSISASGDDALRAAREHPPDLLLLDLMIRGMHGYEVLAALRKSPGADRIPVVVVSGGIGSSGEREARAAGADAFLKKPFSLAALEALVAEVLGPAHGTD